LIAPETKISSSEEHFLQRKLAEWVEEFEEDKVK
jgi:hypothetical protein